MKRDEQAMWSLMLPWLLIIGVCSGMAVIVTLDLIFNLGLSN
jgi:hypothetical protein|tara:strand:- start:2600 stop:2725 length:126 start_codon:yes stop_codon:yes gene_type:complete